MSDDKKKPQRALCEHCGRPPETPICRVPWMHIAPLNLKKSQSLHA